MTREDFLMHLKQFASTLTEYVSTTSGDWTVKGFIDVAQNVYSISSDSKIISKILEIQLFAKFKAFADSIGYEIVLAEKQNWYPDMSFISKKDPLVKFAVDIKTTYRLNDYKGFCNGFTLGSHGEYFRDRNSTKNIQFAYKDYTAHLCIGILYTRAKSTDIDETEVVKLFELDRISSVIKDLVFFAEEKWKIASDKSGSGNTANIGSISFIDDILKGNGTFINLGEEIFDEYWINQGQLLVPKKGSQNEFKKLSKLSEYLELKKLDLALINKPKPKKKNKE